MGPRLATMAVATSRSSVLPPLRGAGMAASRATPRLCDAGLELCVLGLGAWTVAYHVCLLLQVHAGWGLAGLAVALGPCALLAARSAAAPGALAADPGVRRGGSRASAVIAGVAALCAAGARAGTVTALAWATGLAALSLFLVRPDPDDAYYLRQATWIAEHGRFPLGDTLHSHDALPAVFSPPIPSYEGLVGTVAAAAGVSAPTVAYLLVPPAATALAVLALW